MSDDELPALPFYNEHGVHTDCGEDFSRWSWRDVETKVTVEIEVPTEVVDQISKAAADTIVRQIAQDCHMEIETREDGTAYIQVDFFDLSVTLTKSLSVIIDDWLDYRRSGGGRSEPLDPECDDVPQMIAALEAAIAQIRAALRE